MAEYRKSDFRAEARQAAKRMENVSHAELERRAAARKAGTRYGKRQAARRAAKRMEPHAHFG